VLRGAETPRLDQLAAEGMQFLNFNVETQCTPSRSALMTGRHPVRSGTTRVVWGQLYGLTQWEETISELLSDQGYATGMFGKWHLGEVAGRFPTDQGFDEWYGIANTTDMSRLTQQDSSLIQKQSKRRIFSAAKRVKFRRKSKSMTEKREVRSTAT
jgi:arylsulfatase